MRTAQRATSASAVANFRIAVFARLWHSLGLSPVSLREASMRSERALVALVLGLLTLSAHALVPETVVDLPTRGVTQRFLHLQPANPVANLILLPGGDGILRLRTDGTGEMELLEGGALSRNRQRFAEQGFAVAVVDAPSDMQLGSVMSVYRQSTEHLADLVAVIGYMRERADVPVWVVGHDSSAASAVFDALNLPPAQPVGIVLVAGATSGAHSLRNMPLREVRRPVLMISHSSDQCVSLDVLNRAYDDLESAPAKDHKTLTGGDSPQESCNPVNLLSNGYHQFAGLGDQLAEVVADFVRKWNSLVTAPAVIAAAVEFRHADFDHYFLTWVADEIAKLDAGTTPGWTRTGASLRVWRNAQAATSPVCRFYIPPELGDSHFYGRGTAECDETAAKNPSFVLEDPQFMHVVLPTAGVCPAGTVPVYRVFSNRADANHRYMTDRALRDQMVASGWLAEGDGPDLVVMCAPG
jgi:hypothetical protein